MARFLWIKPSKRGNSCWNGHIRKFRIENYKTRMTFAPVELDIITASSCVQEFGFCSRLIITEKFSPVGDEATYSRVRVFWKVTLCGWVTVSVHWSTFRRNVLSSSPIGLPEQFSENTKPTTWRHIPLNLSYIPTFCTFHISLYFSAHENGFQTHVCCLCWKLSLSMLL